MKKIYLFLMCGLFLGLPLFAQESDNFLKIEPGEYEALDLLYKAKNEFSGYYYYKINWLSGRYIDVKKDSYSEEELLQLICDDLTLTKVKISENQYVFMKHNDFSLSNLSQNGEAEANQIILGDPNFPSNQNVTITGELSDGKTGETLIGATVIVEGSTTGTSSNLNGIYSLSLPVGQYTLKVSYSGYNDEYFDVVAYNSGELNVELYEKSIRLEEITISAEAEDANVQSTDLGKDKMSIEAINKLPAFLGEADVVKSILTLPGVSTAGEASSGFNVRGGDVGQNLILMGDGILYNPSHMFGFFSVFNPDVVRDVNLYKGFIPASKGGRVSSVLEVNLKESNKKKHKIQGGIGTVTGRLSAEGPIIKDKLGYILAARTSYSDWILKRLKDPDLNRSAASFYDITTKLDYKINNNNKLEVGGYISKDDFKLASDTTYTWENKNLNVKFFSALSDKSTLTAYVGLSHYEYDVTDDLGSNGFNLKSRIKSNKGEVKYSNTSLPGHKIEAGIESNIFTVDPGDIKPLNNNPNLKSLNLNSYSGWENAIFLLDEYILNDRISFNVGLRYSMYSNIGPGTVYNYESGKPKSVETLLDSTQYGSGEKIASYSGFEPRVSMRLILGNNSSLKLGYTRSYQYLNLLSSTSSVTPVDMWYPSNPHIKPQAGTQYSMGLFKNLKSNTYELSVEGYYKEIENALDYKYGAEILMNQYPETEILQGKGIGYGVEFLIRKNKGRLNGWVGYTYSRSKKKMSGEFEDEIINDGEYYPSNYDKPHDFTTVLNYRFTKRLSFSTNFTYSTGRPISVPTSKFQYDNLLSVVQYSERNQFRIPDYHRLDVSFTLGESLRSKKRFRTTWVFSIYNLYGRKNAYSIYFDQDGFASKLSVIGSAIPALTMNFKIY